MSDALERLYARDSSNKEADVDIKYTPEDLLKAEPEEPFLNTISDEGRDFLFSKIEDLKKEETNTADQNKIKDFTEEEVTSQPTKKLSVDKNTEESVIEKVEEEIDLKIENEEVEEKASEIDKELIEKIEENNKQSREKLNNKKVKDKSEEKRDSLDDFIASFFNSFALELLEDLENNKYSIKGFSKNQMQDLISYMKTKF